MKKLAIMFVLFVAAMVASCGHVSTTPEHSDSDSIVCDTVRANEVLMDTVSSDTVLVCEAR